MLYRYLPEESPDGVAGHEGAFLLCGFWLVDTWPSRAGSTRPRRGATRCAPTRCAPTRCAPDAGPLGLLSEQIDPTSGAFLGNYPQAFSHVGVISSGINLGRRFERVT